MFCQFHVKSLAIVSYAYFSFAYSRPSPNILICCRNVRLHCGIIGNSLCAVVHYNAYTNPRLIYETGERFFRPEIRSIHLYACKSILSTPRFLRYFISRTHFDHREIIKSFFSASKSVYLKGSRIYVSFRGDHSPNRSFARLGFFERLYELFTLKISISRIFT